MLDFSARFSFAYFPNPKRITDKPSKRNYRRRKGRKKTRWKYNRKFRLRTIRYTHSHRLEFHWNEKTLLPFIVAFLLPVSAKIWVRAWTIKLRCSKHTRFAVSLLSHSFGVSAFLSNFELKVFFLCLLPTTSFLFSIEGIFHEFLFRVVTFIASNCVDCARLYSICAFCIAFPVHHMLSFCLHKKVLVLWMWATPFFIYEPIFMDFFLRIFLRLSHCCERTTHTIAQTYTHNFFPLLTCDYYYIRL